MPVVSKVCSTAGSVDLFLSLSIHSRRGHPFAPAREAGMRRSYLLKGFLLFLIATPVFAQSRDITPEGIRTEKRIALVIGNGALRAPRSRTR